MARRQTLQVIEETPPSRFMRTWEAVRSIWTGPLTLNSPELVRMWASPPTAAGVAVNEWTALHYSAVWSAVSLVSDDVGATPLFVYRRLANGGRERMESNPLYRLLRDRPNPEMTSMNWRRTLQGHAMIWGGAFAEIERDSGNRPVALWPITPDRVAPYRRSPNAPLQWQIQNPSGTPVVLEDANVIHIPGLGYDGVLGYRVIEKMRESVSLALAAEKFGANFFGQGATFGGVISYPGNPSDLVKKNTADAIERRHQGVDQAHRFLSLYGDAKYTPLGVPPENAQFQQLRTFQIREAARWFKIPVYKLAEMEKGAAYASVEQANLDYYTSCLRDWFELWEQELAAKLIPALERNQQFIEHETKDLLSADSAGRGELYQKLFNMGAITPNEIRARENLNPVPGGDVPMIPLNTIPLTRVDEWVDAEIDAKKPKPVAEPPGPSGDAGNAQLLGKRNDELEHALLDLRTEHLQVTIARDQAVQDLGDVRVMLATVTMERDTLRSDCGQRDVAIARELERTKWLEADVAQRDARLIELAGTITARDEIIKGLDATLDEYRQDLTDVKQARSDVQTALVAAEQQLLTTEGERDQARTQVTELKAANQHLTDTLATQTTDLRELHDHLDGLERTRLEAEAKAVVAEARATGAEQHATAADVRADAAEQQLTAAVDAARGVVLVAYQRILDREVERARKYQAQPEKLQRHVAQFYEVQPEAMREILRPAVRVWLAVCGETEPLDAWLDRFIAAHVQQSCAQLRQLADESDQETLAPALERVLRRWETERAQATLDALTRKAA